MIEPFLEAVQREGIAFASVATVFDIGSRDGQQAAAFATKFPTATIVAIECNPATLPDCAARLAAHGNAVLVPEAINARTGTCSFFPIDPTRTVTDWTDGNPGASSLFVANGEYALEQYAQTEITVPCVRLDDLCNRLMLQAIDLIWMDLQGAELLALQSLGLGLRRVQAIQIEVSHRAIYHGQCLFPEIDAFLKDAGFRCVSPIDTGLWQQDAIYINTRTLFDVMIPVGPDDIHSAPIAIEAARAHLPELRRIFMVTQHNIANGTPAELVLEDRFPFSLASVAAASGTTDRAGWYLQQLLKLYFPLVVPRALDNILVLDADTYFVRDTRFFDDDAVPLYAVSEEYHVDYFDHMARLHPSLVRARPDSGIVHMMLLQRPVLAEIFALVEPAHPGQAFWQIFLAAIEPRGQNWGASEYEIYFHYLNRTAPARMRVRPLKWRNIESADEIGQHPDLDHVSFHWHKRPTATDWAAMRRAVFHLEPEAAPVAQRDPMRVFCEVSGVDYEKLSQRHVAHEHELLGAAPNFDGKLAALRLIAVGRFGNRVWQVLKIVLVARKLGVRRIWFDDVSAMGAFPAEIDGIAFGRTPQTLDQPTLSGIFMTTSAFDAIVEPIDGQVADAIMRRFVAPFFQPFPPAQDGPGPDVLVMHFRGGDIFPPLGEWVPNHYVMPPAAFYLRAVEHARTTLGVRSVLLVYEDRSNPTVNAVEFALRIRGIAVATQSASLNDDVATLRRATHLVAPFGTFCEGIALLSSHLRSLYSFRATESHQDFQGRAYSLLQVTLQARGVRCFVGTDTMPGYIPPLGWQGTLAQRALMLNYPEHGIEIVETMAATPAIIKGDRDFGVAEAILRLHNGRARLVGHLQEAFPNDPDLDALPQWIDAALDPLAPMPADPARTSWESLIWRNIANIRASRLGARPPHTITLGAEWDFLAESCDVTSWGLLFWLNLLAMRQLRPTRKIAAVAMARDDGIYLLEWVAHHLAIGVEHLFVYTNDNVDGSDTLFDALAAQRLITLVRHTGKPGINVLRKVSQHALHGLPELRDYEWALITDVDEFTIPDARYGYTITRLIGAAPTETGAILIPWRMRCWPLHRDRQPGGLLANFPHASPHKLFKAITRLPATLGIWASHVSTLDRNVTLRDSAMQPVPADDIWSEQPKSEFGAAMQHYWAKSFVEFVVKKQRGDAAAIPTGEYQRDYRLFRDWRIPETTENLDPLPELIVSQAAKGRSALLSIPDIAAANETVEALFAARAAAIAADPELMAIFAAMQDTSENPA